VFDYDAWKLGYPVEWDREPCEHDCPECDSEKMLWLEDEKKFSATERCPECNGEGTVTCEDECKFRQEDEGDYDA
jgi:predicted RNA-binding Zn-ribbon protein involved in translation (DUF1610 family)